MTLAVPRVPPGLALLLVRATPARAQVRQLPITSREFARAGARVVAGEVCQ
jgi:hypothetical protein